MLLKKNKIFFDKQELAFQIKSHPSYPSLHAVTGVLDHFNIENIAADVPVNSKTLVQLPNCFIAQVKDSFGANLVLVLKEGLNYTILDLENKKEKLSDADFLEKFTGIIVVVEQTEESKLKTKNSNAFKLIGFGLFMLLVSFFIFKNSINWYTSIHFIFSLIGFIISVAIIKQELGLKTIIGDAFCSKQDDKKDCDAVLTSKGAKIFKNYKLSDFSILYFTGLTVLTCVQISNPVISFSISLLAIPATLYSLYYQYAVVKKWCLLCLSIVGVLWVQASISLISTTYLKTFINTDFIVLSIVSLGVFFSWNMIKPLLVEVNKLRQDKIESVKFKRNYILFESLLNKSPQLNTELPNSKEIVFGNLNSNLEIILITSPFCGHCKPVHTHIEEILHRYANNVKIKIRFNVNTKIENDDLTKITSRLLEIYNTRGNKECMEAMSDIYADQKPNNWLKKWGNCKEKEIYILELEKQSSWCLEKAINFTPEILLNGKSFPKEYNRTDLIFFIEDLEENSQVLETVK